tara:strand:+ start:509 stop:2056 length:1548 start_codon:yes stop_codon:yes gene_type:complete
MKETNNAYKVLITTSGIGSRLGEITDFTNKSLVRIGNQPVLSHIIESYPLDTKFVITLGHFGSHVKQFLLLAYPDKNFEFVHVDKFKGEGSSLGYSLLQAEEKLQCPFIYHATDTILPNFKIEFDENFCVGSYKKDSSQYASLIVENGSIRQIKPKGELNFDYPYVGVSGIKHFKLFWEELHALYALDPNNSNLHEGHAINNILKKSPFKFIQAKEWFDTGNTTELFKTSSHFKGDLEVLDKKDESVYLFDDFVIKFFHNEKTNKDRVDRAKILKDIVPEILASSENFYKYKKNKSNLLSHTVTEKSFAKLLEWASTTLWEFDNTESIKKQCKSFYIDKTNDRVRKILNNKEDTYCDINGETIPPIDRLLSNIDQDWLCSGKKSPFHGDFILDNILYDGDNFCLIDWRQNFAGQLEYGDIYYDLAKLNHNLTVNHSIVDKGLFNHSTKDCHILCHTTLLRCKCILKEFILKKGLDFKKVEILTSLIWINMSPLHSYPFSEFLFNFGKLNLYKLLK